MGKPKILYVHGFRLPGEQHESGSSWNSIAKACPYADVYELIYDEFDLEGSLEIFRKIPKSEADLAVASSLGGFYALSMSPFPVVAVNPCMKPGDFLSRSVSGFPFVSVREDRRGILEDMETRICRRQPEIRRLCVFGAFSENDGMFSYEREFREAFGLDSIPNSIRIGGDHVPDSDGWAEIMENAMEFFSNPIRRSLIGEYFSEKDMDL